MIEVTCALILKDDKMLLTQRSESMSHPLRWEFPGGKIQDGESPENCIKREISEELHIEITLERMLPSVIYDYGLNKIKLTPFICSMDTDQIMLEQHKAYVWISKDEIEEYDLLEADIEVINSLYDQRL
ncbi:(deoxy)nucleoside triphosphate pyrophosphohydrolase [Bacteroidota bacterium]